MVLQIMPFSAGGHAGLMGAFMLLTLGSGQEVAYTESAGSSQLIERPEDVEPFALAFDALRAQALSPDASIDLVAQVTKDIALHGEPTMKPSNAEWRKSSYSQGNGGNCVEVAGNLPNVVAVRDSQRS